MIHDIKARDKWTIKRSDSELYFCSLCGYETALLNDDDLGEVNGNTQRFMDSQFPLWKCPNCETIHSLIPVDFDDIYKDYPLNSMRKLDIYAKRTLKNLLKRLVSLGLQKNHSILDYGCGNGVFIEFLKLEGYDDVEGFDPYTKEYSVLPDRQFDMVVLNDVLEHVEDLPELFKLAKIQVKSDGLLYTGTADSEGVKSMKDLSLHTMRLHQPFHRKIITQKKLLELGEQSGLKLLAVYTRSYMDTLYPFGNYRFLDEYSAALGHNLDKSLDPDSASIVMKKPYLIFYALFGYFLPSAMEPAVIWRKKD